MERLPEQAVEETSQRVTAGQTSKKTTRVWENIRWDPRVAMLSTRPRSYIRYERQRRDPDGRSVTLDELPVTQLHQSVVDDDPVAVSGKEKRRRKAHHRSAPTFLRVHTNAVLRG